MSDIENRLDLFFLLRRLKLVKHVYRQRWTDIDTDESYEHVYADGELIGTRYEDV